MKRRMMLVTLLITAVLFLLALAGTAGADGASGSCGNGLTWTLDQYNVLKISKTGEGDGRMTSHPWTDFADQIVHVMVKEGVTSICKDAFAGCSDMYRIDIPGSMEEIEGAFSGCGDFSITYHGLRSEWYYGILFPISQMDESYGPFADTWMNVSVPGEERLNDHEVTVSDIRVSGAAEALSPNAQGVYEIAANQRISLSLSAPEIEGYNMTYRVGDQYGDPVYPYWIYPDNTEGRTGHFESMIQPNDDGGTVRFQIRAIYVPQSNSGAVLTGKVSTLELNPVSQGNSGIFITSDSYYLLDENPATGAGYSFTIHVPEGITESERHVEAYYFDETDGGNQFVNLTEKLIRSGNTYTIPSSEMAAGIVHRLYISISPVGYDTVIYSHSFMVLSRAGSENLTVQLTKQDGTIPESWQTGEIYTLHATQAGGAPAITGLRLWNGYEWITPQGGSMETDVLFRNGGDYVLTATGTTANGEIQATPVTVNVAGGNFFSQPFTIETDKYSYGAGEDVLVTFSQPAGATFFTIRAFSYGMAGVIARYSTTVQATSESTQTISIPASEIGNMYGFIEGICYAPGYEAQAASHGQIEIDLRNPSPAIQVNTPATYYRPVNPQAGDGYTFTVTLPEDVQNVPVTEWGIDVFDRQYNRVYSAQKDPSDIYTGTFTIPLSNLTENDRYYLEFNLTLENYQTAYSSQKTFNVMETPDTNPAVTILLTDESGEIPDELVINGKYNIQIQADNNVNKLKVFTGYSWQYFQGNTWSTTGMRITEDNFTIAAYGSTDGGETWTGGYNVKAYSLAVTSDLGVPEFTLDHADSTYTRGQDVAVTILKEAHATEYSLYAYAEAVNGYASTIFHTERTADENEETLTIRIPTAHLNPGSYWMEIRNYGKGYRGNGSGSIYFTVNEATESPAPTISIYPAEPYVSEKLEIYAYLPGAQTAQMRIIRNDGTIMNSFTGYAVYNNMFRWSGMSISTGGNYTIAVYADGSETATATIPVMVASKGALERPTLTGIPGVLWAEDDPIPVILQGAADATHTVNLYYDASDNGAYTRIMTKQFAAAGQGTIPFDIPASAIQNPGRYYISAYSTAVGWEQSWSRNYYFVALDPAQKAGNTDHPIHLAVLDENGSETDQRTWYTTNGVQVSVTAENATEIRVWDGNEWEYHTLENGAWKERLYFGEGDKTLVAQARYSEDGDWISTSNMITLHIIRRVLPAPNVTSTLADEPVERGSVIEFTIGDDPETGETNYIGYYAAIYGLSAEGEKTQIGQSFDWNEEKRKILVPTDNLTPGNYRICIWVSTRGWDPGEHWFDFMIAEPQNAPAYFRVSSERTLIREPIRIIYYEPGALCTGVTIAGDDYSDGTVPYGEAGVWEIAFSEPGTYTLTPYADFQTTDEQGNSQTVRTEGTPIEVEVYSLGKMIPVEFAQGTSGILWAGDDLSVTFTQPKNAESYRIVLYQRIYNHSYLGIYEDILPAADGETMTLTLGKQNFTAGNVYELRIFSRATGWEEASSSLFITATERSAGAQTVTLELMDHTDTVTNRTEWYTGEGIWLRITTDAERVRLWDGSDLQTFSITNGSRIIGLGTGEGYYSFVAMTPTGTDGAWEAASNIINIHVISRELPELEVTTNITDGTVERGSIIRITVGDDPVPEGEETAPQCSYYADLYRATEDGEDHITDCGLTAQRQFVFATHALTAGEDYHIHVSYSADGWEGDARDIYFTVTEPENLPTGFQVSSTRVHTGEPIEITNYDPDAQTAGLEIELNDSIIQIMEGETQGLLFKIHSFDNPGVYTLKPYCIYSSDEGTNRVDGTSVRVIVTDASWTDELKLPDGLTRIEEGAFQGGAFQTVYIPDGCTSIGSKAFADCPNLRYVSYAAGTEIAEDAFEGSDVQVMEDR